MNKILWVDLETTGTDEHNDCLVEIGALVTDERLEILDRFDSVIGTYVEDWLEVPAVVLSMHTRNGLMAESLGYVDDDDYDYDYVVDAFCEWVTEAFHGQKRIPLAGSGIAHFDKRWLDARLEGYAIRERFTFWSYDIGSARRLARLTDIDMAEFGYEPPANKTHRGLDDIEDHLKEAVAICNAFQHASNTI